MKINLQKLFLLISNINNKMLLVCLYKIPSLFLTNICVKDLIENALL